MVRNQRWCISSSVKARRAKNSLSLFNDLLINSPAPIVPASLIFTSLSLLRSFLSQASLTSGREKTCASLASSHARRHTHAHTRIRPPLVVTTRSIGGAILSYLRSFTLSFILYPFRLATVRPRSVISPYTSISCRLSSLLPSDVHIFYHLCFPRHVCTWIVRGCHIRALSLPLSLSLSPLRLQLPALPLISFHIPALSFPCARGSTLSCFPVSSGSLSFSRTPHSVSSIPSLGTIRPLAPCTFISPGILASHLSLLLSRDLTTSLPCSFDPSTTLLSLIHCLFFFPRSRGTAVFLFFFLLFNI